MNTILKFLFISPLFLSFEVFYSNEKNDLKEIRILHDLLSPSEYQQYSL